MTTSKRTTVKRRSTPRRPSAPSTTTVPVWLREQGIALVGQIRSRLDREYRVLVAHRRRTIRGLKLGSIGGASRET